jgi:hypothetical protein
LPFISACAKLRVVLFREALVRAAKECRLKLVEISEKTLTPHAESALRTLAGSLAREIARLGKAAGPPWGKDQKDAALAALVALRRRLSERNAPPNGASVKVHPPFSITPQL